MKDHPPPTQLCPFCGKAFKRLKSHLPYCKMAYNKSKLLYTDHENKHISQLDMKTVNEKKTSIQCSKEKGKHKIDVTEHIHKPKKQPLKDKSASSSLITQPNLAKPPTWNTETCLTKQTNLIHIREQQGLKKTVNNIDVGKSNGTIKLTLAEDIGGKHSGKEHLETNQSVRTSGTSQVVTLLKEQFQAPIPVMVPFFPVLQEVLPRTDTEGNLSATANTLSENHSLQNLNMTCPSTLTEGECSRSPVCDQFSETTKHSAQGVVHNHDIALGDQFRSSPSGKKYEKIGIVFQHNSDSSFLCTKSTHVSILGLSSTTAQENLGAQLLPAISLTLHSQDMHETALDNIKMLETIGKSMERPLDFLSPCKTVSVEDMKTDDSLGLQWIPHLYTNYVRQHIAPGRQDQGSVHQSVSRTLAPPGLKPEDQLVAKHLLDVRLGDLPSWWAGHRFSAKMFPEFMQNAWRKYYNKYINVRKGGVGGLTMLLAGYCVLSYAWNFNHIKQDRWRKYH